MSFNVWNWSNWIAFELCNYKAKPLFKHWPSLKGHLSTKLSVLRELMSYGTNVLDSVTVVGLSKILKVCKVLTHLKTWKVTWARSTSIMQHSCSSKPLMWKATKPHSSASEAIYDKDTRSWRHCSIKEAEVLCHETKFVQNTACASLIIKKCWEEMRKSQKKVLQMCFIADDLFEWGFIQLYVSPVWSDVNPPPGAEYPRPGPAKSQQWMGSINPGTLTLTISAC